ncbi:MAG TPA: hypothetical protein VFA46_18000 [Actinomycetes bacterium]|nr:hypothetical protein [Actinomycetes bacterium]
MTSRAEALPRRRRPRGGTFRLLRRGLAANQHADLILVIERGRLAEQGRHEEPLRGRGVYARLYASWRASLEETETPADSTNAW